MAIYGHPHRSHTCLFPMYRSCIQPLAHTLMTHAFVYLTSRSFTHPTCSRCHAHLYTPRACTRPQISLINRPNTSSGVNAITGNYRPDTASAIAAVMVCKTMRPNDTVLLVHVGIPRRQTKVKANKQHTKPNKTMNLLSITALSS